MESTKVESTKVAEAKLELEVATNIFNEATGDLVDAAIERYNVALRNYELIEKSVQG